MSIFIISHSHMVRDILCATCRLRDIDVAEAFEDSSKLGVVQKGDVVVLHTGRDIDNAVEQVSHLRSFHQGLRIVLITPDTVTTQIREALSDRVEAVMPENNSTEALVGTLAVVNEGYKIVSVPSAEKPTDLNGMGQHTFQRASSIASHSRLVSSPSEPKASSPLSPRESAVLEKLRGGGSNKDIANDLGICEATVKVHLRTCFQKIGVKNRTQAAVWAAERR